MQEKAFDGMEILSNGAGLATVPPTSADVGTEAARPTLGCSAGGGDADLLENSTKLAAASTEQLEEQSGPPADESHRPSFGTAGPARGSFQIRRPPPHRAGNDLSGCAASGLHSECRTKEMFPSPSGSSLRSGRGSGVRVRLLDLPRADGLPSHTGRRHAAAPDKKIRIFIRVCGKGGRLALWIDPDIPVGPSEPPLSNRFTDIFGADAEERGPFAGRSKDSGCLSPFKALLKDRERERMHELNKLGHCDNPGAVEDEDMESSFVTGSSSCLSRARVAAGSGGSLKELLEQATGIAVERQKLTTCVGLMDNHSKLLFEYDIGHGSLLYLTIRPRRGTRKQQSFLASPGRAAEQDREFSIAKLSPRRHRRRDLMVESLPDWRDSVAKPPLPIAESPTEVYHQHFLDVLHGQVLYDASDAIRGRLGHTTQRVTSSRTAQNRALPRLPVAGCRDLSTVAPATAR